MKWPFILRRKAEKEIACYRDRVVELEGRCIRLRREIERLKSDNSEDSRGFHALLTRGAKEYQAAVSESLHCLAELDHKQSYIAALERENRELKNHPLRGMGKLNFSK